MPRRKRVQPQPLQLIDCDEFFIEVRDRSTSLIGRGLHTKQDFAETLGAGYDIASFRQDGTPLHIEVKTTRGGPKTDFFMSPREIAFSQRNPNTYRLVRLYA